MIQEVCLNKEEQDHTRRQVKEANVANNETAGYSCKDGMNNQ